MSPGTEKGLHSKGHGGNVPQVSKPIRGKEGVSLSLMAEACLGRPLDKSMQLSSWAARPLSPRQLTYAGQHGPPASRAHLAMTFSLEILTPSLVKQVFTAQSNAQSDHIKHLRQSMH